MKTENVFWGIGLIVLAVLLILNALGISAPLSELAGGISLLQIALGILLFSFFLTRIFKKHPSEAIFSLSLLFMLFEKNIAVLMGREDPNIINNWLLLGCAAMIGIGLSLLTPEKKSKERIVIHKESNSQRVGGTTKYIDCTDFEQGFVENNLGAYTVHFENIDAYRGGGVLHVENNLGSVNIHVPSSWRVDVQIENSLGVVQCPNFRNTDGPLLVIMGENQLGKISVMTV